MARNVFTTMDCPLPIIPQHDLQRPNCSSILDFVFMEILRCLSLFVVLITIVVLTTLTFEIRIVCRAVIALWWCPAKSVLTDEASHLETLLDAERVG